ncbi:MAG: pPIWI_RE module domain-containing protein, partial [Nostoc sp.]
IETLARSLEAVNPTAEPTNHLELVQGRWRLLYSTFGLERETTLINLKLMRHDSVIWKARIDKILTMIAPHIDIPEPMQFLSDPAKYAPQYLLSHRTRLGSHPVGVGL